MPSLLLLAALLPLIASGADVGGEAKNGTDPDQELDLTYSYEASAYIAFSLEGGMPETNLVLDPSSTFWQINELLSPRKSQAYGSLGLSAAGVWEPREWLSLNLLLDTGELRDGQTLPMPVDAVTSNGYRLGDALGSGSFVCELAAHLTTRGVTAQLGRFRSAVASGMVYDDFGTGANLQVDLERFDLGPWSTQFGALIVGRRFDEMSRPSPLLSWRFDWNLSWFESLGVFAAVFFDRNGESAEVVRNAIAEQAANEPIEPISNYMLDTIYSAEMGRGTVGFVGVNGQLYPVNSLSLHLTALWSPGSFSIPLSPTETRHVDLSAWAAELKVSYGLTELLDVGLVSFALSGGEPPQIEGATYRAFVGVAPYWVWTGLFFSGGLNQGLLPRRAAAAGINGHGVIGGGPVAMLTSRKFQAELRAIWLRALVDPPAFIATNGKNYGLELDGLCTVELISWLSLSVETDLLIPGSYLPSSDLAYRAFALLRGSYGR